MATLTSLTINDTGNVTLPNGTIANRPTVNSTVVTFTTVGSTTWTVPANVSTVEVLVVGGGGGGGSEHGGGGGGGGVVYQAAYAVTPGASIPVTVGGGGAGGTYSATNGGGGDGVTGSNSIFGSLVAFGGGGGTAYKNSASYNAAVGKNGGSGGGGGPSNPGFVQGNTTTPWGSTGLQSLGGEGVLGQGSNGGIGGFPSIGGNYTGGGGGGAGGPGGNSGASPLDSFGGPGRAFDISGTLTYYGGGGGSSYYGSATSAPGGIGGGGASGNSSSFPGVAGSSNTGGGGGGSYDNAGSTAVGGTGGSGIVIVRYALTSASTTPTAQSRFNTLAGTLEIYGTRNNWKIQSTNENIVTNGLVMHLDGSRYTGGTTWYDLTTNNNHVTLYNGPTSSTSNGGNVLFDGSNDYGQVTTFTGKPTNFLTLEAWVRPTRTPSTGTIRGGAISNTNSTYLGIIDSQDGGVTHGFHFANQTTGSRTGSFVGKIPNNRWSHIVGTYDGVRCKGYINGVLVYDVAQTGTISSGEYVVGTYGGGLTDGIHNWLGGIGVARIYNRALSNAEILINFNAGSNRFINPSLVSTLGAGSLGSTPGTAASSARQIKELTGTNQNGFYWIKPGNLDPLYLWCDMNYDGGGWALVLANCRAGTFTGAPGSNGIGALRYEQVVHNNNINGTYTNLLQFRQFVGVKYWPALGLNAAQFCSTTTATLSNTAAHTKRYRWRYTGMTSLYAFTGGAAVSDETGTGSPGFYSHNVAGGYNLTTTDRDQDSYGANCANLYGGTPNWYSACWSGNPWGGGNGGGYADAPFWDGSGSDNHNYMAIYLKV